MHNHKGSDIDLSKESRALYLDVGKNGVVCRALLKGDSVMQNKPKVFIAGAFSTATGLVRLETLYERLGSVCEEKKFETFIPHRDASSKQIPDLTPQKMYRINMDKLSEADLLIAYVGQPSTGVGMEVQQAALLEKNVVLLSETGKPVSTFLMGCPGIVRHILFKDFDDAIIQLGFFLDEWLAEFNTGDQHASQREILEENIAPITLTQQPASIIN